MRKEHVDWTNSVAISGGLPVTGPLATDDLEEHELRMDEQFLAYCRARDQADALDVALVRASA